MDGEPPSKRTTFTHDKFLFADELHDVVFQFEDPDGNAVVQTIPAHSQILAFVSEVFHTQLFGALQERNIKIKDASVDNFRIFVRCIYTGELRITTENMFELAYLANKYMISKITQLVAEYFKDELDKDGNFWKLFNPQRINLFDDKEKSLLTMLLTRFERDTSKHLNSEEFLSLGKETIGQLVRCDLSIKEVDLYKAVVRWAEFQCKRDGTKIKLTAGNMRRHVKEFIRSLRMPTLCHDELFYNGGIRDNELLLPKEKVNLAAYCGGLISTDTPFEKIPRRKSRDVIVCTAELVEPNPNHIVRGVISMDVLSNTNFRFVGVTYVLNVQKTGEVPEKITTEVRSSENFSENSNDYDLLCSFVWTASPGMEVSNYEVVSMANDIILFSAGRHYRFISLLSPGISINLFENDFKDDSSQVYIRKTKYLHTVKSVHFLLP